MALSDIGWKSSDGKLVVPRGANDYVVLVAGQLKHKSSVTSGDYVVQQESTTGQLKYRVEI